MKICWDNLEKIDGYNSKRDQWFHKKRGGSRLYYEYKDKCHKCGEPFLSLITPRTKGTYCSLKCLRDDQVKSLVGKRYGPVVVTKFFGRGQKNNSQTLWECRCDCGKTKIKSNNLLNLLKSFCGKDCGFNYKDIKGKKFGKLTAIKKLGQLERGQYIWEFECECGKHIELRGYAAISGNTSSCGCAKLKYGINLFEANLVPFDTYADKLSYAEGVSFIELDDLKGFKQLLVRCTYCNKWFAPSPQSVWSRIYGLTKMDTGENRFYCSDHCKMSCPIFNQKLWARGEKPVTSREVQPTLRKMVLERDNWICQHGTCGKTVDNAEMHCHHIEGININPIESADIDMCITLCKEHHELVHTQEDCKYHQLKCPNGLDK